MYSHKTYKLGLIIFILILFIKSGCRKAINDEASTTDNATQNKIDSQREAKMSDEAQSRKERSIKILKVENMPYIDHLPVIEAEDESTRRSTEEVALRAIALCLLAVKGEGLEQEIVDKLIEEYKITTSFTPQEKAFIENPNPSQQERIQFLWRYECYWVMLWALGYIEDLGKPESICDVEKAVTILRDNGRDNFIQKAKLRPQAEILDAADLLYRYHWAVVNARINNREDVVGLDSGVVMERHYALNWLIGYMDQEWDDITTDT